jgi:hypothetical protein
MENRNDLLNELKNISPLLAERKKENLFSVPENYFSTVEVNVMEKIYAESVSSELQNSSLKNIAKQNAFDVPYGYFERLPNELLQKTSRRKSLNVFESVTEWFAYSFRPVYFFAAAPVVAVLILAVMILFKPTEVIEINSPMAQVSNDEIRSYLSENISSFDESLIIAQMDEKAIGNLNAGIDIQKSDFDNSLNDLSGITLDDIQNL